MKKIVVCLLLLMVLVFAGWSKMPVSAATMNSSSSINFSTAYESVESPQTPEIESGSVKDNSTPKEEKKIVATSIPKTGDSNNWVLVWLGMGLIIVALILWLSVRKKNKKSWY